ncbi:MAG: MmcQ/YjbR family DNA-binding protein [Planctomycetes bacterium]|nr:MmcQ/YjbR family DNA-binding protein [Planctomycetota bacterium]
MNVPTIAADRLQQLRELCLSLPDTEEKIAWGDPTWRIVGGRMFAGQKGNVPGHRPALWFAAPPGMQSLLVEAGSERFFVPPYVGSQGWVGTWMDLPRIDWAMIGDLLAEARQWIAASKSGGARRAKKTAKK